MELARTRRSRVHPHYRSSNNYSPRDYPCRDTATAALRPVPPGQTRAEAFCPSCKAERCLLDRDAPPRVPKPGRVNTNAAFREECRRTGITTSGRPLARRCWNCVRLRRIAGLDVDAYVCHWRWGDSPPDEVMDASRSRKTMLGRAPSEPVHGCGGTAFRLRRGPIGEWRL